MDGLLGEEDALRHLTSRVSRPARIGGNALPGADGPGGNDAPRANNRPLEQEGLLAQPNVIAHHDVLALVDARHIRDAIDEVRVCGAHPHAKRHEGVIANASAIWHQMLSIATGINFVHPLMYVGFAFTLVSCIMILVRKDHRCIHDFIAGTKVALVEKA